MSKYNIVAVDTGKTLASVQADSFTVDAQTGVVQFSVNGKKTAATQLSPSVLITQELDRAAVLKLLKGK